MLNFNSDAQNPGNPAPGGPTPGNPTPGGPGFTAADQSSGVELEPWLVIVGETEQSSLAMWQLAGEQLTVALFSGEQRAADYADKCCSGMTRVVQVDRTRFLSLMVDCFRQGIRYATLNPGDSTAQSLFVLRDVLSAAKQELSKSP